MTQKVKTAQLLGASIYIDLNGRAELKVEKQNSIVRLEK